MPRAQSRRRTSKRPTIGAAAGYTLAEVIIAMLISCVMVTAMLGVSLTQKQNTGKSDRRLIAAQALRQLTSQLRLYVTGCGCDPTAANSCNVVGCTEQLGPPITGSPGPNKSQGTGAASWYFNSPTATPPIYDKTIGGASFDQYALSAVNASNAADTHTITGLLPAWFEAAPYNAKTYYLVAVADVTVGTATRVDAHVDWTEP